MNCGRLLITVISITWIATVRGQCSAGWKGFGNKCYYFGSNKINWTQAEDYCVTEGGHLAKDTSDVHSFLSSETAKLDPSGCSPIIGCNLFIGAIYRPGVGYKWSDGTAVDSSFMPWNAGEPNNGNVVKSAEFEWRSPNHTDFQWNDRPLDYVHPNGWYICERPALQCADGWQLFGTSCYYFGTNKINWTQAEDYCVTEGGHLAKDTSDVHSFLSSETAKLDTSGCSPIYLCNLFIGAIYRPGVGYKWSDGTAVNSSFMPWNAGEPNGGNVVKSAEFVWRSPDHTDFQWNDRSLNHVTPNGWYICERPAFVALEM